MAKDKIDLSYFRKFIPAEAMDVNHRKCLFAEDCKLIKKFKNNPDHYHFFSKLEKSCFTVSIDTHGKIIVISHN